MHRSDVALRIDKRERSVQAESPALRAALDEAEVDRDPKIARKAAQPVQLAPVQVNRLLCVMGEQFLLPWALETSTVAELGPEGVARQQRFAEDDNPASCSAACSTFASIYSSVAARLSHTGAIWARATLRVMLTPASLDCHYRLG